MERVVLIPAYKPSDIIVNFVKELKASSFEVVVVDDGGGGDFDGVFNSLQSICKVIRYTPNKGKGAALKTGFKYIRENMPDTRFVITADADGQHKIGDIISVADRLSAEENKNVMVIGARHFENKVPFRSKFGNITTRFVFRLLTGQKVVDTQTGLRGFPFSCLQWLESVKGDRYEYEMNMLMKAVEQGIKIRQVEIETVYENDNSSSHFRPFVDSVRIYKTIFAACTPLKYLASALLAFAVNFGIYSLLVRALKTHISFYLPIAFFVAWAISSFINFTVNRSFVFEKKDGFLTSFAGYYSLAVVVSLVKFGITYLFADIIKLGPYSDYIALPIAEAILFVSNYFVQKIFIFKKSKSNDMRGGNNGK